MFAQILEALDQWLDGNVAYQPAWLGPCAATPAALQQAQQQHADQGLPEQPQHNVQQVKCLVPGELLMERQQQQQHRQWRDTVRHVSANPPPEPQSSNVAARGGAQQPRTATGQMDWSEVSFECLRHGSKDPKS